MLTANSGHILCMTKSYPVTHRQASRLATCYAPSGNAVKDLEAGFSWYVAVRSANVRIFAERKATYLPTVRRQNA